MRDDAPKIGSRWRLIGHIKKDRFFFKPNKIYRVVTLESHRGNSADNHTAEESIIVCQEEGSEVYVKLSRWEEGWHSMLEEVSDVETTWSRNMIFTPLTARSTWVHKPTFQKFVIREVKLMGFPRQNSAEIYLVNDLGRDIILYVDDWERDWYSQFEPTQNKDSRMPFTPDYDRIEQNAHFLTHICHEVSRRAGWDDNVDFNDPYVVGTKLMLIVSEVAEAMEGHRKGLNDDKLVDRPMLEVELADAAIRIFHLAGALGYGDTFGKTVARKIGYNVVRADHKPENRAKDGGKKY